MNQTPSINEQFNESGTSSSSAAKKTESQAKRLLKVAESIETFHNRDGDAFATVPIGGHNETYQIKSRAFKRWWAGLYYRTTQQVPPAAALADAVNTLEGIAIYDGPEIETHTRIAGDGGKIYVDLANDEWEVIEISSAGWKVVSDSPVRFIRPNAMMSLPTPVHGGVIGELRKFVNIDSDADFQLLVAFITCALRDTGPYLILSIGGEKGSAKSCLIEFVRLLIDPNKANIRSAPRKEDDLLIAAKHSWIMTADNLSDIPQWLSDAWCRLSTGGGLSKRELYLDSDEIILTSKRPIILAGITEVVTSSDLVDRVVRLECPTIADGQYKTERTLRAEFEDARPRIIGALMDAISAALKNLGSFTLEFDRMADESEWCCAAWPGYEWEPSQFLEAYQENRRRGRQLAIEAEPVGVVLVEFVQSVGGSWSGSATNLYDDLNKYAGFEKGDGGPGRRRPKNWPMAPHVLSGKLRVLAPDLRETGTFITFDDRDKGSRRKIIKITTNAPNPDSERSENASGGVENATPNALNACSGLLTSDGDVVWVMGKMTTALAEQFSDHPDLSSMLDQLGELTDLLHLEDGHPIELAARMAFERVVADQGRGAA